MDRNIRISAVILSVILISSCATDRIQISSNKEIACKTPKTRYDFGRNKPTRSIKSNNSKYFRYVYNQIRNSQYNRNSSKKTISKNEHPGKFIHGSGETKNYFIPTQSDKKELIIPQQIPTSSEIGISPFELKKNPDPVRIIKEPNDIFISPPKKEIPFSIDKVKNESRYTSAVLNKEEIDAPMPNESFDITGVAIQNNVKSNRPHKTPYHSGGTFIYLMAILAGLIPLALLKAFPKFSANVSFRAAMNPWKTRFMFAGMQIGLGTAGVLLGERLANNGINFSDLSRDLLVGAFLTSSMLYPVKHTSIKLLKHTYLRQKAFDLALAVSGFMLMVNAGNDPGMKASITNMVNIKGHMLQNVNKMDDHSQSHKQLLYYQTDKQLQDDQTGSQIQETSQGLKTLYTILILLGALVLGFLLAGAACGLSCNGMEGLAYLVGIGGGALLIGLTVLAIKSIWHPKHKKRMNPSENTNPVPQAGSLKI